MRVVLIIISLSKDVWGRVRVFIVWIRRRYHTIRVSFIVSWPENRRSGSLLIGSCHRRLMNWTLAPRPLSLILLSVNSIFVSKISSFVHTYTLTVLWAVLCLINTIINCSGVLATFSWTDLIIDEVGWKVMMWVSLLRGRQSVAMSQRGMSHLFCMRHYSLISRRFIEDIDVELLKYLGNLVQVHWLVCLVGTWD
jgi:hypothetical protein